MINIVDNGFVLSNELFSRRLEVNGQGVRTVSVINRAAGGREYWKGDIQVADFEFVINGVKLSSWGSREVRVLDGNVEDRKSMMRADGHSISSGEDGREILRLTFAVDFCGAALEAV